MELKAIYVLNNQKNEQVIHFEYQSLTVEGESHLYDNLRFEIGGNNDSILFIHISDNELIYISLDRQIKKTLLQIDHLRPKFQELFKISHKTFYKDLSYIGLFLVFISSLIYFRSPIAGAFATLVPVSVEKSIGDKIFSSKEDDSFKSVTEAEKKLKTLLSHIKSFDDKKFTVHISSKKELNAYATIGGHLFINKGLIDELQKPEDLLGVVGHEMVHAEKRHVIKSIFQGAGLFLLIQTLLGDVTGLAAVLADNSGSLLQLSYSRELEAESDMLAVQMMLDSRIDPSGLKSALQIIENEYKKILNESPGADKIEKILNQNFLRSHPKTDQRCLEIQKQIDDLRKNSKYENVEYINLETQWADFKNAMKEL